MTCLSILISVVASILSCEITPLVPSCQGDHLLLVLDVLLLSLRWFRETFSEQCGRGGEALSSPLLWPDPCLRLPPPAPLSNADYAMALYPCKHSAPHKNAYTGDRFGCEYCHAMCWAGWPRPSLSSISPESPWGQSESVASHSQSRKGSSMPTDLHRCDCFIHLSSRACGLSSLSALACSPAMHHQTPCNVFPGT